MAAVVTTEAAAVTIVAVLTGKLFLENAGGQLERIDHFFLSLLFANQQVGIVKIKQIIFFFGNGQVAKKEFKVIIA